MTTPERRLQELGLTLPEVPAPVGNFLPGSRNGRLLFLSGQGPLLENGELARGKVGREVTTAEAYHHSRRTALVLLSAARGLLGSLDPLRGVVWVFGFVNCVPDYDELSSVADGCSDLLTEVLGDDGRHARTTIGVASLPGGISVEYQAVCEIGS